MPRHKQPDSAVPVDNLDMLIENAMKKVLAGIVLQAPPEMLRIGEVARMLSMSTPTVRKIINNGQLPFYVTEGGKRFKRTDVMDYINSLEPCRR